MGDYLLENEIERFILDENDKPKGIVTKGGQTIMATREKPLQIQWGDDLLTWYGPPSIDEIMV